MKKKADHVFHKHRKQEIESKERQTQPSSTWFFTKAANSPIHFPKRKKK